MNKIALIAVAFALLPVVAACSDTETAIQKEQRIASQNNASMTARCGASTLTSQEKINLCERAKRINVQNMTSCIALFTQNGALVAFHPVKGKVTSLNSYLLPGDEVVGGGTPGYAVKEAPDIDGAYGKNADGIFFFTADTDSYVEWQGDYYWSDQCLAPSVQPLLVQATHE